jgi:hypothetical protein
MTNGVVDISIKEKTYRLRFNGPAGLLFQSFMAESTAKPGSNESNISFLVDLFYCGFYGEAKRSNNPIPKYEDISDLFDVFMTCPNFAEDTANLWKIWGESVVGSDMIKIADSKKKELESLQEKK